jgi:hypothetical protein
MNKFIVATSIALAVLASPMSNAAMVVYNTPLTNPFTFAADKGILTFSYSGPTVSQIAAGDDNTGSTPTFANQNYNTVGNAIETVFSLPANTFAAESSLSGSFKNDISASSATITSSIAYDYLAVHFGGYEVFFHFAGLVSAGTEFNISGVSSTKLDGSNGGGGGLSNYRVYNSGISEIPIPAAAFMFAPALLGFMGLRRRAKNAVA